jgi:hypothetical protein
MNKCSASIHVFALRMYVACRHNAVFNVNTDPELLMSQLHNAVLGLFVAVQKLKRVLLSNNSFLSLLAKKGAFKFNVIFFFVFILRLRFMAVY